MCRVFWMGPAVVLLLAGVGGWALTGYCGLGSADVPVLAVERTRHDFGMVAAGSVLHARFPVTNHGGRRLIIIEESTSCECVAPALPEIVIEPGATAELETRLQTAGLRGGVQMEVRYVTSDPRRPRLVLTLLADMHPDGGS